ncbi:LON peptidase substrate-binding domain-containing protein [Nevskia soli]|jgi:Lon protease-like protein|uniref:LON peptidase substrate-binding domain-containing protein n=1 Tax=Nevskia soli TaxID=418856 RepID=UPI0015D932EF|nr:LON peptidase substrate-binding domain-containing protein [Nevskia soli]
MAELLPLFPLQLVVFPRTSLPLHIFEDRYKEMVDEAIRDHSEFGIVLAKEDGIVNAGCTVYVDKVLTRYPDGRLDIVTQGFRRFELLDINQERAFLRGTVEFFDDDLEAEPAPELKQTAIARYQELAAAGEKRANDDAVLNDAQLSFQLAQAVPDLDFQNQLLRSRSETERLQQLNRFLEHHIPRVRQRTRMRQLAPRNGFSHKIAGV